MFEGITALAIAIIAFFIGVGSQHARIKHLKEQVDQLKTEVGMFLTVSTEIKIHLAKLSSDIEYIKESLKNIDH